jgi:hypothetical protein
MNETKKKHSVMMRQLIPTLPLESWLSSGDAVSLVPDCAIT